MTLGRFCSACEPACPPAPVWTLTLHLYVNPQCVPARPPAPVWIHLYSNDWQNNRFSVCPSVHPERFLGIFLRTNERNGQKFSMLTYLDRLRYWLDFGDGLLILFILSPLWLNETAQMRFPGISSEHMGGMAWNMVCWYMLNTFRTD